MTIEPVHLCPKFPRITAIVEGKKMENEKLTNANEIAISVVPVKLPSMIVKLAKTEEVVEFRDLGQSRSRKSV